MAGSTIEPYSRWNSLAASAAVSTSGSTSFDQSPSYLLNTHAINSSCDKNAIIVIAIVSSGDSSTQQYLNLLDSDEYNKLKALVVLKQMIKAADVRH